MQALRQGAAEADLVLASGVSVGEEDHVKTGRRGARVAGDVEHRHPPGKPVAFGHVDGTAFIGSPGNPVSVRDLPCCSFAPSSCGCGTQRLAPAAAAGKADFGGHDRTSDGNFTARDLSFDDGGTAHQRAPEPLVRGIEFGDLGQRPGDHPGTAGHPAGRRRRLPAILRAADMTRILYFASLRERLGCSDETLGPRRPRLPICVPSWPAVAVSGRRSSPTASASLAAVNQEMAGADQALQDGDEVGFFSSGHRWLKRYGARS